MLQEFGRERLGKDRVKFYTNLQNELYSKLTHIFKLFFKKETQRDFFDWIYACILGNLYKSKLGARLMEASNKDQSHDGFVINIFVCLLNLCKGFLSK